jgi:hypothetical protein
MTTPASAIKDRSEKIGTLCQELNRIGTRSVMERRLEGTVKAMWGPGPLYL